MASFASATGLRVDSLSKLGIFRPLGFREALDSVLSPWTMQEHTALQEGKPIYSAAIDVSYGSANL